MKILLMGNPNIGKSAFFSRLTGVNVVISNYPGTTVEFKEGKMKLGKKIVTILDVPGTYTLESKCKAEKVALNILKEGDLVVNIIDATNLERNLHLTLELLEKKIPVILALNCWDETKHKGIEIDIKKLEQLLKVPVVPTIALTGEGIKEVVSRLKEAKAHSHKYSEKDKWAKIGDIVKQVQKIKPRDHTVLEKVEDLSIKPLTGIPIAVFVLVFVFWIVRVIGETLIVHLFEPLFELYLPLVIYLDNFLGSGIIHDLLIGTLIDGKVDYLQSMGLLTTGLFVPFAMVLPYVFSFYLVLGLLEDSGYLPRLATLVDTLMHRLGMHGLSVIPMLLGLGCNVPAALSTRILETRRQRFIVATLMAIAVPCMAQLAMIFGLLGKYGITGLGILFATLFLVWFVLGFLLNKLMKGVTPETFMEIPPYRVPYLKAMVKKLWMRMRGFFTTAIPFVLVGILFVNLFYILGIISFISEITAPVIVGVLGLPKEAVLSLIIGFLRKDVAVGALLPLNLSMKQLIIACTVLTMYFPCVATFVVLFKELGVKDMLKSVTLMILTTLLVGGILNLLL